MLKITVVAVGKLKEKFWTAACDEYLKRLRPYAKVTVAEIPDVDPARAGGVEAAPRARGRRHSGGGAGRRARHPHGHRGKAALKRRFLPPPGRFGPGAAQASSPSSSAVPTA